MAKFRATAVNEQGWTFQFTFENTNWADIEAVAKRALEKEVLANRDHKKYGPWTHKNVEIAA